MIALDDRGITLPLPPQLQSKVKTTSANGLKLKNSYSTSTYAGFWGQMKFRFLKFQDLPINIINYPPVTSGGVSRGD